LSFLNEDTGQAEMANTGLRADSRVRRADCHS